MTELGEIPEEWEIKKLKDISKVIDSLHETPIYSENGFPMLRVVDVNGKAIDTSKANKVSEEIYLKFTRKYEPQKEDIIMSRVGSYGLVSYLKDNNKVCLGQNIVVITTNDLYKRYLFYSLNSNYIKSNIDKVTVGSSQKTLSLNNINEFVIAIPPLQEQQKIASILSTVDEQIDNVDALIEKNKELKKGLMQTLLTKGIGHTKFKKTEIGEIPEEWEVSSLESRIEIRSGNSPSDFKLSENGKYPFFKVDDMNYSNKYINNSKVYFDECKFNLMTKGMVIFPKRGASIFTNKVGILNLDGYFDTNIMGVKCKEGLYNEYLFYQLKFIGLEKFADTTAVPQINNKHINPLKIPIPLIKEQETIVSILSEVDSKIEKYENKKVKLEELKRGLMQQLLTGNIRTI